MWSGPPGRRLSCKRFGNIVQVRETVPVDVQEHIAKENAGGIGRSAGFDVHDKESCFTIHASALPERFRNFDRLHNQTDIRLFHVPACGNFVAGSASVSTMES